MIFLKSPTHKHAFVLEKEAYGSLPKKNVPVDSVMWGQIESCPCGAKRIKNDECLKRGGDYGYIE